jgi:hypothetical protein
MDRPQFFRRLRIAASVFFAVVTAALCLLWVRSYSRVDILYGALPGVFGFEIASHGGRLVLKSGPEDRAFGVSSQSSIAWRNRVNVLGHFNTRYGGTNPTARNILSAPHVLGVALAGFTFLFLQIRKCPRFSLRTLLIATTLVAVVLGLGFWSAR